MFKDNPFHFLGRGAEPEDASPTSLDFVGRCDPRLLERLGVRKEVCEAAAKHVADKGTGE